MSVSCVPNDLAANAACLTALNSEQLLAVQVSLLCSIANMDCDPQTLASDAACLTAIDPFTLQAISVFLLCSIANTGGSGSGCVTCSSTVPVAPPNTDDCPCAITFGIGDLVGFYWVWDNGFTNTWVKFPGGP